MPKGPQGQKRPADAVANAVMVARIATGEIEDDLVRASAGKGNAGRQAEIASFGEKRKKGTAEAKALAAMELKMSGLSLLKKELFGDPSSAISDIKFYPGEGSFKADIDDIALHALNALNEIRDGNCRDIDLTT